MHLQPSDTNAGPSADRSYDASIELYDRACHVLAGGVSSNFRLGTTPSPLFFARAEGPHLFDVDDNRYVDYALGMGPGILGHAPAHVIDAVARTLPRGQLYAGQHPDEVRLAETFAALIPCAERVRFGMTGSEMVQAALRLARAATGRRLVVKFEGHYHGWFDTILVSVQPDVAAAGAPARPTPVAGSAGQSAAAFSDVLVLPWNDLGAVQCLFAECGSQIAAVICEPILCNTCVVPPVAGYLEGVRAVCSDYGSLLIFDEVVTGFRVGLAGAQGRLGVTPDLAVFAKALGAGFPIAAVAGRADVMDLTWNGGVVHGGTFNASPQAVAAAIATIEELSRDGGTAFARMEELGVELMSGLRSRAVEHGAPLHVQGLGMAFNTCFTELDAIADYRQYASADAERQRSFLRALQDRGVRVTGRGTWFLSAAHDEAAIARTLSAADAALACPAG